MFVDIDGEQVSFRWHDYAHGTKRKVMRLDAKEFVRCFLFHVLPRGVTRLRHCGVLADRGRIRNLALCRSLLHQPAAEPRESDTATMYSVAGTLTINGIDVRRWLKDWLTVCAENGGKPPHDLSP